MKVTLELDTSNAARLAVNVIDPQTGEIRQLKFTPEELYKKLFGTRAAFKTGPYADCLVEDEFVRTTD